MTITTSSAVNSPAKVYFTDTTGKTSFASMVLLKDGVLVPSPSFTVVEILTTGLYVLTYTPTTTGNYLFCYGATIVAYLEVVAKTSMTILRNLEDEAIGSWQWDKQAGTLTMIRQDGTNLANFAVVETITEASRERVS